MFSKRPDITPAQALGALFGAVGPVCVLVGVELSKAQVDSLDDLKVIGLGLFGADAIVRVARNHKDGKVEAAAVASPAVPHDLTSDEDEIGDVDPEVDTITDDDLPSDDEEFTEAIVQPSPSPREEPAS